MIALDQIVSLYSGTKNGLNSFSSEFHAGVYALLGKNGSGKTTLFRNLIGAIFPQHGSCQILGEAPKYRNPDLLKEIFLIPEEPFFPNISPQDYVRGYSPFYPRFDQTILHNLLSTWEVPQASRLPQMSQGQKKKFLISFAFATRARIMLFDEPTNGLDIVSKMSFKSLGAEMFQEDQLYIFATHQIKDVENLIDHVTLIDNGKCWGNYLLKTLEEKFITEDSPKNDSSALFSLQSHDRYLLLKKRKPGQRKKTTTNAIDLEIFFTAFLQNPEQFKRILEDDQK